MTRKRKASGDECLLDDSCSGEGRVSTTIGRVWRWMTSLLDSKTKFSVKRKRALVGEVLDSDFQSSEGNVHHESALSEPETIHCSESDFLRRYQLLEKLGEGAFGVVHRAFDRVSETFVAVKIQSECPGTQDEVRILKRINSIKCPELVSMYCDLIFEDSKGELKSVIIMELCGESLLTYMHNISSFENPLKCAQVVARDVLKALNVLHMHRIIHTDLKPENILMWNYEGESNFSNNSNSFKVADLGHAQDIGNIGYSYVTTRIYRAPEVVALARSEGENLGAKTSLVTEAVDIFSLGCILVEIVLGRPMINLKQNHHQSRTGPDREHLALLIEVLGSDLPVWIKNECPYFESGLLKHAHVYRQNIGSLESIVTARFRRKKWGEKRKDLKTFLEFIRLMLEMDPVKRLSANMLLHHQFLQCKIC